MVVLLVDDGGDSRDACCIVTGGAGNFLLNFADQRTQDWHAETGSFEWSLKR